MRQVSIYTAIASALIARHNCIGTGNDDWKQRHEERIAAAVKAHMPSGSGFDAGTKLDLDRSTPERLVFTTAFHHMDEHGYYCGWSEHMVIVRASLWAGFDVRVTGRDKRDIKQYIAEVFDSLASVQVSHL